MRIFLLFTDSFFFIPDTFTVDQAVNALGFGPFQVRVDPLVIFLILFAHFSHFDLLYTKSFHVSNYLFICGYKEIWWRKE